MAEEIREGSAMLTEPLESETWHRARLTVGDGARVERAAARLPTKAGWVLRAIEALDCGAPDSVRRLAEDAEAAGQCAVAMVLRLCLAGDSLPPVSVVEAEARACGVGVGSQQPVPLLMRALAASLRGEPTALPIPATATPEMRLAMGCLASGTPVPLPVPSGPRWLDVDSGGAMLRKGLADQAELPADISPIVAWFEGLTREDQRTWLGRMLREIEDAFEDHAFDGLHRLVRLARRCAVHHPRTKILVRQLASLELSCRWLSSPERLDLDHCYALLESRSFELPDEGMDAVASVVWGRQRDDPSTGLPARLRARCWAWHSARGTDLDDLMEAWETADLSRLHRLHRELSRLPHAPHRALLLQGMIAVRSANPASVATVLSQLEQRGARAEWQTLAFTAITMPNTTEWSPEFRESVWVDWANHATDACLPIQVAVFAELVPPDRRAVHHARLFELLPAQIELLEDRGFWAAALAMWGAEDEARAVLDAVATEATGSDAAEDALRVLLSYLRVTRVSEAVVESLARLARLAFALDGAATMRVFEDPSPDRDRPLAILEWIEFGSTVAGVPQGWRETMVELLLGVMGVGALPPALHSARRSQSMEAADILSGLGAAGLLNPDEEA
jgi:hypothetical protein